MKNLNEFDVVELSQRELLTTNGGLSQLLETLLLLIGSVAYESEQNIKNNDYWYRSFTK